tara:strand:- start:481 stop:780 length:300 start_codon:yes stop_codon:yes gene_type:complete
MKTTVYLEEFSKWFEEHRPHNFSRVGLVRLFDYLEEYEESTGESIEFDPIAICCEYSEYQDLDEFHQDYNKEDYPDLDEIRDYTHVIELGNESFIIQCF